MMGYHVIQNYAQAVSCRDITSSGNKGLTGGRIENLWQELKEYTRRKAKPTSKDALIAEIQAFWETVTVEKCQNHIDHLEKVMPKVIQCEGAQGWRHWSGWSGFNLTTFFMSCNIFKNI